MSKKTNTFELGVFDRITLLQMLPTQASFTDLLHTKNVSEKISFKSEEAARLELRTEVVGDGQVTKWKQDEDKPLSVTFTPVEIELIRKQIDKLDKEEKLHISMFDLVKKIRA